MIKVLLNEAKGELANLIEMATAGEEVILSGPRGVCVRLVPLTYLEPREDGGLPRAAVGSALDRFIGTWSAEQEAEVLQGAAIFEQIDESFWS